MQWVKLGDIVKISKGKKEVLDENSASNIRYIQIDDLRNNNKLKICLPTKRSVHVTCDDVIIAWDGANAGTIGYNLQGVIGSTLAKLKINDTAINSTFLGKFLKSQFNYLRATCTGATIPHISKNVLLSIKIPLPSLGVQEKIVGVLDEAQQLIDSRQEQLKLYDELIQATFYEMFGDPITNPKNWQVKKIGKMGLVQTGNTPPRINEEYYGDFIEWVKSGNINTPYSYLSKASEFLSKKGLNKGRLATTGSLLITCIAGSKNCIGNVAIANRDVCFNQQINSFTPEQISKKNTLFLYSLFLFSKKLIQSASSNGMKGIVSKSKFEKIKLINPPLELQQEFARKVEFIEEQKELCNEALQEMTNNFNSLMQKAFNGELF